MSVISSDSHVEKGRLYDERLFRQWCASVRQAHPDRPVLKDVTVVGAKDIFIGIGGRDDRRVTDFLDYTVRSGAVLHEDFEIDAVSFLNFRDTLEEDHKADIFYVSFILASKDIPDAKIYNAEKHRKLKAEWEGYNPWPQRTEQQYLYRAISKHSDPENWHDRAVRADTKIIATHGGLLEVATRFFDQSPFETILPSPTVPFRARESLSMQDIRQENIDIPTPWLGVCMDRDYREQLVQHDNPTDMSRRARAEAFEYA